MDAAENIDWARQMRKKSEGHVISYRMVRKGLTEGVTDELMLTFGGEIFCVEEKQRVKRRSGGWCEGYLRNLKDMNGAGEV